MPFDLDPLSELTSGKSSLDSLIVKHSERTGLDPDLVRRLVHQESRGKSGAVSPKGAGGTMQLMPTTARELGVKNVFDPDENIRGGTDYLRQQLDRFGDVNLALAAYNAGPGAVIKHGNKVPPYAETQNYVKTIGSGYQGTGYAQDPLTELTSRKTTPQTQQSDPLTELAQSVTPIVPQPQGRGASMAAVRAQPKPRVRSPQVITPDMVSRLARSGLRGEESSIAGAGASRGALTDADRLKEAVRLAAPPGFSLLPEAAQNVIGEQLGKGASGVAQTGAGLIRNLPHDPLDQKPITGQAANVLNEASQTLGRGGQQTEKEADRPTVNVPVLGKVGTQDVYNLAGGAIGSSPALILTALDVPAPVAFGLDSYLKASGRDADWQDVLKETGLGAATGALFEIPLPARMALLSRIGAKLGLVGGGTYGLEKIAGMPESEARKNAAVNALFAASGAGKRGEVPEAETLTQTVPEAMQGRVRLGEIKAQAAQAGATVINPEEVIAGGKPKVRTALREGVNEQATKATPEIARTLQSQGAQSSEALATRQPSAVANAPEMVSLFPVNKTQAKVEFTRHAGTVSDGDIKALFPDYDVTLRRVRPFRERRNIQAIELTFWEKGGTKQVPVPADLSRRFGIEKPFGRSEEPQLATESPLAVKEGAQIQGTRLQKLKDAGYVPVVRRQAERGAIQDTSESVFFSPYEIKEGGPGESDYGPALVNRVIDKSAKIFNANSSYEFAEERGLLDKTDPVVKRETGYDTLRQMEEAGADPEGRNPLDDGFPWFRALQQLAAQELKKEGYQGVFWHGEDALSPNQYQIWDRNVLKRVGEVKPISEATGIPGSPESQAASARSAQGTPEIRPEPLITKPRGTRSFPQTLAESKRESGTDLTYEPITNPESRASAKETIDKKGVDSAMNDLRGSGGAQRTALGIELIDRATQAAKRAEQNGNNAEAATRYAQAAEAASLASHNLTTAGQEVQAAQIANRYTPEGALREGARIAQSSNIPFGATEAKATGDIASIISESNKRIQTLEKTVADLRAGRKVTPKTTSKIETVKDYFVRMETDAKTRLEARAVAAKSQTVGARGERGAAVNPVDVAASLSDWTIIGASKIARGGLNFAQWQAEMVRDLGEQVRPYLDKVFREATIQVRDRRKAISDEMKTRSAERRQTPGQSLQDALEDLNGERAKNRQAKRDLDRHFREMERADKNKILSAGLALSRDSLLSARGFLRLLSGMTGKQAIDFGSRFVRAGLDVAESKALGTPRTSVAPSFGTVMRSIGGFAERVKPAVKGAFSGKGSDIMPEAYPSPKGESPYVTYSIRIMQKLYGTKEAVIRSWAYPDALENQARTFAVNDASDGLIKRSEIDRRARDYVRGRIEFDGARNQRLAKSLAQQAADYEVGSKQIIPSMRDVRVKEMLQSPTELLHSTSLQAADKAVYAQPNRIATKARGLFPKTTTGQVAQNIVLPFAKRPANNIADNLFGYTGLRAIPEGGKLIKSVINKEFNPAQVKSFNDAVAKGATGFAVMTIGAVLNKKGILTSPLDKDHPASIKVNGKYYNVGNVPVVGWLLGMGAAYQADGVKAVPVSMAKMILEHPLLRSAKDISEGLTNIAQAKSGGDNWLESAQKGATRYVGQTLSRVVPAPVKIAAEASDTKERDTSGLAGPIRASIPGVRQQLKDVGNKPRTSVVNPFYTRQTYVQDQKDRKSSLIQRGRRGENIEDETERLKDRGLITPQDAKSIARQSQMTATQWSFESKPIVKALDAYENLDSDKRQEVRKIVENKVTTKKLYELDPSLQSDIRLRMKRLGLHERTPDEIVPQEIKRVQRVKKIPDYSIRPTAQ